ncbi:hypothetical protein B7P43_G05817 [Cryptotermes secundus]|uniref:Reverse transcriptase domain-containing protein n=1 Tax=Cryptotermes secundus TaxID=105785 RepID=A0A2J7PUN5_9NEOP|nr:hypothetical protein B7P43_G05817 [Cryptotermes secundus]
MVSKPDNNTGCFARSPKYPGKCFDIYYQNVRGLRTKQVELYDNICSTDYNIICLTETWLNDLCYDHNLFPDCYTVFRSDRASVNKTRGGGVLTALSSKIRSCKRRYDLESCDECVWVEIPTSDGLNLLIGNHYFPPDANPENIANYFRFLENNLDTHNFRVIMVGDFNAPGFDWKSGLALPNSHYYSKLKGDAIYTSTCLLNLNQCIDNVSGSNLLDLIFSNLSDISITPVDSGLIKPDNYHPPLIINICLSLATCIQNYKYSYRKFSSGDYALLYNNLSTYDWSCVYGTTSVDSAVAGLNAAVQDAMEHAIPRGIINTRMKFPHWYSSSLKYYIRKKNYFYRRFKKKKSDCLYQKFSYYRKLVKSTIKSDRLRWLKSVDENLKSQPKQFWKYVASFRKRNSNSIQLEVDGKHLIEPHDIADEFSKHFQTVYHNPGPIVFPNLLSSSEFLPLASVSDSDVIKAIKRLRPSKSVGVDDIPGFIIKGCTDIFVPILKHIFNLSLSQHNFPSLWKQAAIVPVLKKGKSTSVSNYRPISLLSNFSKIFEFIVHEHVSHYLKSKISPYQHGFSKTKSTSTNLVTYIDFISPIVGSQRQADAIYFDLSNAFDLVPHSLLLHKLSAAGLSGGYVSWFRSYLSNRKSQVRVSGVLSSPFEVLSGVPQGSVLGPLLFNVFINDMCDAVAHSKCLLFADDIKIYRAISSPHDCYLLQSDVNSIQGWCIANCMKLNISKTKVISFTRKTNLLIYDYKLFQTSIARTDSVKDLGVFIDAKLYFHDQVNYIFSQCAKLLGLVRNITYNFSSLDCMFSLYTTLVRSKLEYESVVWNSITSTDANKLERIQQRFAALCFKRFFPQVHYNYSLALEELKLHTLCTRRHRLDALFLIQVYFGSKFCPSALEIVGLRVPARYIRDFALFNVCSLFTNCPSARCAAAANVVCRDVDVFGARNVLPKQILNIV